MLCLQEHHLQRAIVAGMIIPTPEVYKVEEKECFKRCYPGEWKIPRNLIHMQRKHDKYDSAFRRGNMVTNATMLFLPAFTMEQDIPDYDMDSDDEKWINTQAKKLDLTPLEVLSVGCVEAGE